jgi:hypothetical protein
VIRLHASPAPLQRKLVAGKHLALVTAPASLGPTDDNGAANPDIPSRFFSALALALGPVETRAWFRDAVLEASEDTWRLVVPTAFKADWIRGRFTAALERGREAAGLDDVPAVVVRPR